MAIREIKTIICDWCGTGLDAGTIEAVTVHRQGRKNRVYDMHAGCADDLFSETGSLGKGRLGVSSDGLHSHRDMKSRKRSAGARAWARTMYPGQVVDRGRIPAQYRAEFERLPEAEQLSWIEIGWSALAVAS